MKKRLRQYPKFPGPVAAVTFNCDGKVAGGVSYTWDEGEKGLKANAVAPWLGVRMVGEEVKVCSIFVYSFFYVFFCPAHFWFLHFVCKRGTENFVISYNRRCHIS